MVPGLDAAGIGAAVVEKAEDILSGGEALLDKLSGEGLPAVELPSDYGEDEGIFQLLGDHGESGDGPRPPDDYGEKDDSPRLPDDYDEKDDSPRLPDDYGEDGSSTYMKEDSVEDNSKKAPENVSPYDKEGNLIPSNEYELNGYHYQTDELGRISEVSGNLILDNAERNKTAQKKIGKLGGETGYDGGHVIGSQFGGNGDIGNLIL